MRGGCLDEALQRKIIFLTIQPRQYHNGDCCRNTESFKRIYKPKEKTGFTIIRQFKNSKLA